MAVVKEEVKHQGDLYVEEEGRERAEREIIREQEITAPSRGGLRVVRDAFLGEQDYKRPFQLGLAKTTSEAVMAGIRGSIAEFFAVALFLFFNITVIEFIQEGNLATLPALQGGDVADTASRLHIAACFGFSIYVLVFAFAAISGGHINPAITFAFVIGRRLPLVVGCLYWIGQLVGAIVGTAIARAMDVALFDAVNGGANSVHTTNTRAFGGEVMGTFLLVLTVLVATNGYMGAKMGYIPLHLPLAIGMAVFVAHLALIPIDNCSINPARSFGPAVVANYWEHGQWVFYAGPFVGSTLAALLFEAVLRLPEPTKRDGSLAAMAPSH
ncbi:unnamed protein product [Phaeothamnion confervicola]